MIPQTGSCVFPGCWMRRSAWSGEVRAPLNLLKAGDLGWFYQHNYPEGESAKEVFVQSLKIFKADEGV